MKLTLGKERAVEVLTAAGPIEARDAKILKVGVAKLIKDGKHQIAIEVSEPAVPSELLDELVALDQQARQVSGQVVVVASHPDLAAQIGASPAGMSLSVFPTRDAAASHFEGAPAEAPAPAPAPAASEEPFDLAAASGGGAEAPVDLSAASDFGGGGTGTEGPKAPAAEENKLLREQIRTRELKEVGEMRKAIARLEEENKALTKQLETVVTERRSPPNEAAYIERVRDLEDKLVKLMEEIGAAQGQQEKGK